MNVSRYGRNLLAGLFKLFLVCIPLLTILLGAGYAWYRYTYPFGHTHCCDKVLASALIRYAETHEGNFPAHEDTPEASLSLLHTIDGAEDYGFAYLLAGKSRSEAAAQELFDAGHLLTPETCGWNYVPGLRTDDDTRLALFWDKEGLGHNGQRLSGGGYTVCFVHGHSEHIPAADWDQFLEEQKELYVKRKNAPQKGIK